jgi:hypothetical protein
MKRKRGGCCEVGVWWLLMGQLLELRDGVSRQYDPGLGRSFSGPRLPLLFSFKEKTRKLWTERQRECIKQEMGYRFWMKGLRRFVFSLLIYLLKEKRKGLRIFCVCEAQMERSEGTPSAGRR